MLNLARVLEEILLPHVSVINARVIVERSRRALRDPNQLSLEDRARFIGTFRASLRLFMSEERAAGIVDELESRLSPQAAPLTEERCVFTMRDENDLRVARAGARDTCLAFAASTFDAQRVATAVSELGRNILAYTPGGQIELEVRRGPPARVRLVASDSGKGIAQLETVLAGQYRSRTGLGRGLIGVKRLMDQFRVQTGAQGTRIEAEVTFQ